VPNKRPIAVEVLQEGDERLIVFTYADGEVIRQPVQDKKATRRPKRPHQRLGVDKTRKKKF
jgi:hypothetical protein